MKKRQITINVPEIDTPRLWVFAQKWLIPNPGTLILMIILALAVPAIAKPYRAPSATSVSTIPYQGRLADASGNPITDKQNIEFRIYDVPTGGTPLWEEFWTGANSVNVSDGLFSVMLGSIEPGLADVVQANDELYLGITVGTDSEMAPRVQLGSVPFSMQALTVPDGSVTSRKLSPTLTQVIAPDSIILDGDPQTVISTTVTVDVPSRVWLMATCDFRASEGGLAVGFIQVDGQGLSGSILNGWSDNSGSSRQTVSSNYVFDLTPGSHTIALKASMHNGVGSGRVFWNHTKLSYIVLSQ